MSIYYKVPKHLGDDVITCSEKATYSSDDMDKCIADFMFDADSETYNPDTWPIEFILCDEQGKHIKRYNVYMEFVPEFYTEELPPVPESE